MVALALSRFGELIPILSVCVYIFWKLRASVSANAEAKVVIAKHRLSPLFARKLLFCASPRTAEQKPLSVFVLLAPDPFPNKPVHIIKGEFVFIFIRNLKVKVFSVFPVNNQIIEPVLTFRELACAEKPFLFCGKPPAVSVFVKNDFGIFLSRILRKKLPFLWICFTVNRIARFKIARDTERIAINNRIVKTDRIKHIVPVSRKAA